MQQKFRRNLSPVLFVVGLSTAAAAASWLDHAGRLAQFSAFTELQIADARPLELQKPRQLTQQEIIAAKIAWKYIEKNTRAETGLVDSVEGFPSSTLWDQGSYLLGLVSAWRLGIVDQQEFERRTSSFLAAFERMELVLGKLPNKAFDTRSLEMTDYQNNPTAEGIGWSALDVARLLSAFRVLEKHEPSYAPRVQALLYSWDLDALTKDGELLGSSNEGGSIIELQEGRLGYEQYGARAAAMWGLDVAQAISARRNLEWREISGVKIPTDLRRASSFGAITPILSEPYFLMALEFGFDSETHLLASQVYQAQEARYEATGEITMVSEDHIDQDPFFLYSSIFSNGEDWAVVNEAGRHYPSLRTLSVKSSFAWNALLNTSYTNEAILRVSKIGSHSRGWPAGIYEENREINEVYTLNTNAIILQSIYYTAFGSLWKIR